MSSKKALKQAQKQAYAKHRSNITNSRFEMKKNNFTNDETVELSTRRGKVEVKVRFDKMIPDGMVFMPFCFENAPANLLTNQALDPDGKIPELKYCAAKIAKVSA